MATTIRTPSPIDLTDQRVQVGDTIAFVDKINATQQKLEQWTGQDWNNFAADVAAVAGELEQASSAAASSASAASNSQTAAASSASAANSSEEAAQVASSNAQAANAAAQIAKTQSQILVERAEAVMGTPEAIEAATGGSIVIRYTDKGEACYFFKLPAFNCEDIAPGGELGTGLHPAFIKNGVAVPYILIGVHSASFKAGEFLSQPGKAPAVSRTYDQELAVVAATGAKFRQMNNYEWAALSLWCMANGYQPLGNTQYGRHHTKRWEVAQRQDGLAPGYTASGGSTITGTGPNSWRHNNAANGIADLVGNVWERVSGLKLIDGVFHVAPDGGDYLESEYINTGVSAGSEGVWSGLGKNAILNKVLGGGQSIASLMLADGSLLVFNSSFCYRCFHGGMHVGPPSSLPYFGASAAVSAAVQAADGSVLVFSADGKYARSTDNGMTFGLVQSMGQSLQFATSAVLAADGSIIVATYGGTCARSTDNGLTFTIVSGGWTAAGSTKLVVASNGNVLIFGNGSPAKYRRSTNHGATFGGEQTLAGTVGWVGVAAVVLDSGRVVVCGGDSYQSQCVYSDDNGVSFSVPTVITNIGLIGAVSAAGNMVVVAGADLIGGGSAYAFSMNGGVNFGGIYHLTQGVIKSSWIAKNGVIGFAGDEFIIEVSTFLRRALAIPASSALAPLGYFWRTMTGERVPLRSGYWYDAGGCGLAALYLYYARSAAYGYVGLRLAYRDQ